MAKISRDLINKLTEFLVCELGSKALGGITYILELKDKRGLELFEKYKNIKELVIESGFENDQIFRIFEIPNGYIFDMDLNVVKKITDKLMEVVENLDGEQLTDSKKELLEEYQEKRRRNDMMRLAKYIKTVYDNGDRVAEVALFSKNEVPRIVISGRTEDGEIVSVKYDAFAVRHLDLEQVNANLLIPAGIRISMVEPCEVLPSRTGCKFKLYIEKV